MRGGRARTEDTVGMERPVDRGQKTEIRRQKSGARTANPKPRTQNSERLLRGRARRRGRLGGLPCTEPRTPELQTRSSANRRQKTETRSLKPEMVAQGGKTVKRVRLIQNLNFPDFS